MSGNMFVYVNYKNLEGGDLDEDFKAACIEQGATEETEVSAIKTKSTTGHDAYIVTLAAPTLEAAE